MINTLTDRKVKTKTGIIPADNQDERDNTWFNYFKGLLGAKSIKRDLNLPTIFPELTPLFNIGAFTMNELIIVLEKLKYNKATGLDQMPAEVLKIPEFNQLILDILNYCYENKTVPNEFLITQIIPIYKKGNSSLCKNYRGIALTSICAKLYNRLLLERIISVLDKFLRINQNGFRPNRSTAQQVLTMRRLIEATEATQDGKMIAIFIDFSKAFDSVDWNYIEQILLAYGVPKEIVDAVMSVYIGAKATDGAMKNKQNYLNLV